MRENVLERDFNYSERNEILKPVGVAFHELAKIVNDICPDGPANSSRHKQMALTKVLEARYSAIEAVVQYEKEMAEEEGRDHRLTG